MRQLVLLLVTAVVSFILGIVIGRGSAPVQPIIKVTMPATTIQPGGEQNLNFYKALPKGATTALGSGINQITNLPATTPITPPSTTVSHPVEVRDSLPENAIKPQPVTSQKVEKSGVQESWILQAASIPQEKDAQALGKKLRSKGYKTEIKPVQVKGKTWFRVYVGPYSTATAAKEAAAKLSRQERLAPIARKI